MDGRGATGIGVDFSESSFQTHQLRDSRIIYFELSFRYLAWVEYNHNDFLRRRRGYIVASLI